MFQLNPAGTAQHFKNSCCSKLDSLDQKLFAKLIACMYIDLFKQINTLSNLQYSYFFSLYRMMKDIASNIIIILRSQPK